MRHWDDAEQEYNAADMIGRQCFAGLDLSSTRDVTALVLCFPDDDGTFRFLPYFWIPEDAVNERARQDRRLMQNYADQGHVELTEGNEVDALYLVDRIVEICDQFAVERIGFDPWNAAAITQLLKERGIPEQSLLKMPQTMSTYNEPFKRLLAGLPAGKIAHDGNPVLRFMAANVAHVEDANGNIRPHKGKSAEKIDGVCAALMGLGLAIHFGAAGSAYESEGAGVVLL